jgi:hypothetical protein
LVLLLDCGFHRVCYRPHHGNSSISQMFREARAEVRTCTTERHLNIRATA